MKKLLFLALLLPCLALGQEPDFPLGKKIVVTATLCVSEESALKIAASQVNQGADSAEKEYRRYARENICQSGTFAFLFSEVYQVNGRNGVLNVYRTTFKDVPIYVLPLYWTTDAIECTPSPGNVCV